MDKVRNNERLHNGTVVPEHITIFGTKELVDPRRGDGLLIELDLEDSDPYLAKWDGDYSELYHICCAVWETKGTHIATDVTIGLSKRLPRTWAKGADDAGQRFVEKPTLRSKACRCVIDAIRANLKMN